MRPGELDTEELLERIGRGERAAGEELLARYRGRLRQMVAIRLDRRLAARVDPSDLVQETLAAAAENLDAYVRNRRLPFYPWLRGLACERLDKARRRHLGAQRRTVLKEERADIAVSDESVRTLAHRLLDRGSSPSRHLMRSEQRDRVRAALAQLPPRDRELIVMRHLEQMETAEIAAVLGLSEGAVRSRQFRALLRMRAVLEALL